MEWPPCASSDSGRVPCTLSSPATGAGAATLAAEAAEEGVRERRDEERRAGRMTSSIHRWSRLIFPVFNASLSFCALFLSLVATRPMRREARGEAKHCTHVYLGSKKKQKTLRSSNSTCSARAARPASLPAASRAPPRPAPQPPLLLPRPRATTRSSTSGGERCSPRPAASP